MFANLFANRKTVEIDLVTGRYIQSDPIGFDGGVNTYLYVGANPVVRVDEEGKYFIQIIGAIIGAGIEAYVEYKKDGKLLASKIILAGVTGALGGFGSTTFRAIGFATAANGINSVGQQMISYDKVSFKQVGKDLIAGAVAGGFGYKIMYIGKAYKNKDVTIYIENIKFNIIRKHIDYRLYPQAEITGGVIGTVGGGVISNATSLFGGVDSGLGGGGGGSW